MILIVTNREDYTADFLILELRRRSVGYVRFNTEDFPQKARVSWRLHSERLDGFFSIDGARMEFSDIHSIWYRRPVPPVPSSSIADPAAYEFSVVESQAALDGVWRTLDCFWVSHPDRLRESEIKLFQLKVAAKLGFHVWPTLLTNDPAMARSFYTDLEGHMIYKPLRRSRLVREDGVSLIYTSPVTEAHADCFDSIAYAPCLLQRHIPKRLDVRVTVIGASVFAVAIRSQDHPEARNDWRRGSTLQLAHELHALPSPIEQLCARLVRELGLAFGAIDLVLTPDGEYVFLEINPNGQWAWIQQICPKVPLRETLADLLISGSNPRDC